MCATGNDNISLQYVYGRDDVTPPSCKEPALAYVHKA